MSGVDLQHLVLRLFQEWIYYYLRSFYIVPTALNPVLNQRNIWKPVWNGNQMHIQASESGIDHVSH